MHACALLYFTTRLLTVEIALTMIGVIVPVDFITATLFFYANWAAKRLPVVSIATCAFVPLFSCHRFDTCCRRQVLLLHVAFAGFASIALAGCLRSAGITWFPIWRSNLCEFQQMPLSIGFRYCLGVKVSYLVLSVDISHQIRRFRENLV